MWVKQEKELNSEKMSKKGVKIGQKINLKKKVKWERKWGTRGEYQRQQIGMINITIWIHQSLKSIITHI